MSTEPEHLTQRELDEIREVLYPEPVGRCWVCDIPVYAIVDSKPICLDCWVYKKVYESLSPNK